MMHLNMIFSVSFELGILIIIIGLIHCTVKTGFIMVTV